MTGTRNARGAWAEQVAHDHLCAHGLHCETRNYRCRAGELDLVMHDQQALVFVEVRYRSRTDFGSGADSVDHRKQMRVSAAAGHFLVTHPAFAERCCRFDVVSVSPGPRVEWIRDAFEFAL